MPKVKASILTLVVHAGLAGVIRLNLLSPCSISLNDPKATKAYHGLLSTTDNFIIIVIAVILAKFALVHSPNKVPLLTNLLSTKLEAVAPLIVISFPLPLKSLRP